MIFRHGLIAVNAVAGFASRCIGRLGRTVVRSCTSAAETGATVFSAGGRLTSEHAYAAVFDDCCTALECVANNAAVLSVDPDRIVVVDNSTDGNLAAVVSLAWAADHRTDTVRSISTEWRGRMILTLRP